MKTLFAALLSAAVLLPAADQYEPQVGHGLACDTQEQVERYVTLYQGSIDAAIGQVNQENYPRACIFGPVSFYMGPRVGVVVGNEGVVLAIIQILAVGIPTPFGMAEIPPTKWFIAVPTGRQAGQEI